jgi:hypothetical protein
VPVPMVLITSRPVLKVVHTYKFRACSLPVPFKRGDLQNDII